VAAAYAAAAFLVNSAFELSSLWFRLYGHYEKKSSIYEVLKNDIE
jgi:hypothetical protein